MGKCYLLAGLRHHSGMLLYIKKEVEPVAMSKMLIIFFYFPPSKLIFSGPLQFGVECSKMLLGSVK